MRELDDCYSFAKKIQEKHEEIIELKSRTMSPKNQIISDMPRGGNADNAIERYLIKIERLKRVKKSYEKKRDMCWLAIQQKLCDCGFNDKETLTMMYMRFGCAWSWNKCAKRLSKLYKDSNWNTNKCFRVYRQVLNKLHKKAV